jgi:glycerol-3-phosphate acyltransferase PlsY
MIPDSSLTVNSGWPALWSLLLSLLGYLWGSLLPAEWLSRRKLGRSLQEMGDNPGTSAAWRVLGARAGLLVLAFDLLKGAVPFLLARAMLLQGVWLVLPALAPVVGHNWPVGRWRRGGHGLGPGGGVLLSAGWPVMAYSALVAAVPAVAFFRRRWGVTLAALGIPLGIWLMIRAGYRTDVIVVVVAVTLVLALRLATDAWRGRG